MTRSRHLIAVVVAWNGGDHLDRCIESLRGSEAGEILLIDNGSERREQARLRERYGAQPGMRLIALSANHGFAEGANIGMREALEAGATLVLLATQDILVEPGAVERLADVLEATPEAGIAGPIVLDSTRPGAELSRGERFVLPLICLPRTVLRYRRRGDLPYEVSGLMGCFLLFSRRCLEKSGGFDPAFFAYYEEVDLCWRARQLGFRILCVPGATVHHHGMRGFLSGFSRLSAELKARNLILLLRKLGSGLDWLLFLPAYTALVLSSAILYLLRGRADISAALLRGVRAGMAGRSGAIAPEAASSE